jgi:hypothetical protein
MYNQVCNTKICNTYRRILNSHLFWLNSHPFFARPIICRLNLSVFAPPPWCSFDLRIYIIQFLSQMNIMGVGQTHSNLICILSYTRRKGVNLTKKGVNLKFSYLYMGFISNITIGITWVKDNNGVYGIKK